MKKRLVVGSLLACSILGHAQWTTSGTNIYNSNTGNVGIGITTPAQKLDVRGGAIQVVNTASLAYSYIGRDANPGNDSYFYHRMTANYHILGGSKNGTGTMRKLGFAIGGSDFESDVKMTIVPNGNVGIGNSSPNNKLSVSDNAALMTNNQQFSDGTFLEPSYSASYHELLNTTKEGWHVALQGYDLNNAVSQNVPGNGLSVVHGIGVFGKAQRTTTPTGFSFCIGVYGKALGALINIGGVFNGDLQATIGGKQQNATNENGSVRNESYGLWASSSSGVAGYLNGSAYSTGNYQNADAQLKEGIKPIKGAMDKLSLLKPTYFAYKTDEHKSMNLPAGQQMGLTAQDVEKEFPELVKDIKDISGYLETGNTDIKSYKAVNYTNLIPLLIAGIQEQQSQLEKQNKTNEELRTLVATQQQQINDMQAKSSAVTGISNITGQTDGFSMDQNVPNPFSNETLIRYNLPQSISNAYMAVYDLSGKQITTFQLTQKGTSSVKISSDKLSAGIYIYSIIADGKVMDSKRMVVEGK